MGTGRILPVGEPGRNPTSGGAVSGIPASRMVDHALQYAGRDWAVFPLQGKIPFKGTRGFKDATADRAKIEEWWSRWPQANIGLATGNHNNNGHSGGVGLVVLDVDGTEGLAELKALVAKHGPLPATLAARTGNGLHLYFAGSGVRSSARGKLHVRGTGGYVVAPPSVHPSGRVYAWIDPALTVAPLPDWLKEWMVNGSNQAKIQTSDLQRNPTPAYLAALPRRNLSHRALQAIKATESTWSPQEQKRIESALAALRAKGYDFWIEIGMALHSLQWIRSDGTDIGLEIWDAWSQTEPGSYLGIGDLEPHWRSFRSAPGGKGIGTLFHHAKAAGWIELPPTDYSVHANVKGAAAANHENVTASAFAALRRDEQLPPEFNQPTTQLMPDRDKAGHYRPTCRNVRGALRLMNIECSYDLFAEEPLISGDLIQQYAGGMSDPAILVVRRKIEEHYNFDPGGERTRDAVLQEAYANAFNPVLDYLDELQWDGRPRLATWLAAYLGADAGEINAEIGTKTLVAAVRRARQPGVKFDQLVVLEGRQGSGKTTALKILAGPDHYSDQSVLAVADREQQEALRGVWIHEISELTGIRRAAVDKIKHFLSRTEDRARPAYGHFRVDLKRHGICIGTTNDDEYLKDETGNRRFWPVVTRSINTDALRADRDQLWAEAAALEARGCSIELDRRLWAAMANMQELRMEQDEWVGIISQQIGDKLDTSITEILMGSHFMMAARDINQMFQNRAARALKQLGFRRYRSSNDNRAWRYRKLDSGP